MKLYRTASKEEILELVKNGRIEGTFDGHPLSDSRGSSYNGEFGSVLCAFTVPRVYGYDPDCLLEIEIDENEVLGEGFGRYADPQMNRTDILVMDIKEVYLKSYSLTQVKCVGGFWVDADQYLPTGEVDQIINFTDAGDDIVDFKMKRQ
jgi:hypothetical protein